MYPDKDKEFDFAHAKISLKIVEVKLTNDLNPPQQINQIGKRQDN